MEVEREITLRRNPSENVVFKILVPSIAAGSIIGKGGETIAQVQNDHKVKVKMSKATDFYPGTTERVCLIQGSVDAIMAVSHFIMDKVLEKPDPNPRLTGDGKLNVERHKQVKILLPNSTAGMIIGKKGAYIKEIMDESHAFVQVSQKPKEQTLTERCVTIAGDSEANRKALELILAKVAEDPQSGSCPNVSYAEVNGPVASAYPTGSPFAAAAAAAAAAMVAAQRRIPGSGNSSQGSGAFPTLSADALRASLRNSGYSDSAADEIISAVATLANYGFFNLQSLVSSSVNPTLISTPAPTPPIPMVASPHSSFNLPVGTVSAFAAAAPPMQDGASAGQQMDQRQQSADQSAFIFSGAAQQQYDTFTASFVGNDGDKQQPGVCKREMEVPEALVGVIIGPGGKDIIELQNSTQCNIQISRRNEMQPQHNRVVTITGMQPNATRAERIIEQRIKQEDHRRQQPGGASAASALASAAVARF